MPYYRCAFTVTAAATQLSCLPLLGCVALRLRQWPPCHLTRNHFIVVATYVRHNGKYVGLWQVVGPLKCCTVKEQQQYVKEVKEKR